MIIKISLVLLAILLLLPGVNLSQAADNEELEISINEAVERALQVDKEVRKAGLERDLAREEKFEARDELRDSYAWTPETEQMIEAEHTAVLMAELGYQISSSEEEATKDDVRVQAIEEYIDVLNAQDKVELEEQRLEKARWEYNAARAEKNAGMLSSPELRAASRALESQKNALGQAEEELDEAYTEFNVLIGLWPERRPVLTSDIFYDPVEVRSVVTEVNRAVDSSEELRNLAKYIQIEHREKRTDYLTPQEILDLELDISELERDEVEEQIKTQVRIMINNLKSMEKAVDSAREGVEGAQDAKETTKAFYEAGLAARGELIEVEEQLFAAQQALKEAERLHSSTAALYRNITGREIVPASW